MSLVYIFTGAIGKPGGTKPEMEQNLFPVLMFHLNEDFSLH